MSGFFLLHRGWMDSFKPEPFTEREAFVWSIEQAAYEDHEQWFNGQRIHVVRGEFATSQQTMATAFGWSIKKIRGFMDRMGKAEKWAQRRAHQGAQSPTIITVLNYTIYQEPAKIKGIAKGRAKGAQRAQSGQSEGTQQNKGKERKEVVEEESPTDSSIGKPIASVGSLPAIDDVAPAFAAYQRLRSEFVPGARPLDLSPARRKALAARLREIGGPGGWDDVLARVQGSPFLRGETDRFTFATIDWLLKQANLLKVREGNYDERRPTSAGKQAPVRGSPIDALSVAIAASGLGG